MDVRAPVETSVASPCPSSACGWTRTTRVPPGTLLGTCCTGTGCIQTLHSKTRNRNSHILAVSSAAGGGAATRPRPGQGSSSASDQLQNFRTCCCKSAICGGEWRTPIPRVLLRVLLLLWGHEAAVTSNAVPEKPGSKSISTDDRLHGCSIPRLPRARRLERPRLD